MTGTRVVLITGGIRGIGRAVALALAERGWSVAACYRTSAEDAASLDLEIQARGARSLIVRADVSDPAQVEDMVGRVEAILRTEVKERCKNLAPYKRITRLTVRNEEFEKTTTKKIKRFLYTGKSARMGAAN